MGMADDKIGTHYEGCEQYHLECAKHALADRDRRIEALTKALRELAEVTALLMSIDDMNSPEYRAARKRRNAALYGARECLASAAGAEGRT